MWWCRRGASEIKPKKNATLVIRRGKDNDAAPRFSRNTPRGKRTMTYHPGYIHDRTALDDSFGRSHFAKALSSSLVLPKGSPGLVVGIEGDWGSGKSTLIGFITKSLGEITSGSAPILVEFNPWMVSNTGALVEALIGQLAASIGKDLSNGKKGIETGQKLLNYVGLLKHLKYVPGLSWAGHVAEDIHGIVGAVTSVAEQSTEAGQKAISDFKRLLPSLDISQKRAEVVAALEELDHPIVIIIDDLDRLPAEEIRAMIQAIKAVADFPRITYLLAYDRNVIARALAADEKSGLSYLEKIVQVAYPIPPSSQRQLKKFANDKVQNLLNGLQITLRDFEQSRYEEAMILLTNLSRHPRDIIRVVNRLTLSLPMTHNEVNAADVIVFEALSQRFPDLREAIRSHPVDFIGHPFRDDLITVKDDFDWQEYMGDKDKDKAEQPWLRHLPKDKHDQSISKQACLFLFSPQEKNGRSVIPESYLGIADPDRLARLFRMISIEDVPEAKEIHKLMQYPAKLKNALHDIDDEQLRFLLEWMINYAPSCSTPDVKGCIKELTEASVKLTEQCRLADKLARKFADLIEHLLRRKISGYEGCFLDVAKSASLSIAEDVVCTAAGEIGKWGDPHKHKVNEEYQLISNSDIVDKAIQTWLARVRECIAQGILYREANLFSIFYRFAQFNNNVYEEAYDAISKMCQTDKGLAAFLKYFEEGSPFNGERLMLAEDAEKLAQRIANSALKDEYHWLVELLGKEETIKFVQEQTTKLKRQEQGE